MRSIKALIKLKADNVIQSAVPEVKGLPFIGSTLSLLSSGGASKLHQYIDNRHKELGSIFKENLGSVEAIFISDPEYMRAVYAHEGKYPVHVLPEAWMLYNELFGCSRGLFFMNGNEWLHNRRLMNSLLLKGSLEYISEATHQVSTAFVDSLEGNVLNLEKRLYKWSLDNIMAVVLGTKSYDLHKYKFEKQLQHLSETVFMIFHHSAKLQFIPAKLAMNLRISAWKNFTSSVDETLFAGNELVQEIINTVPNQTGLLDMMKKSAMSKSDISKIITDMILAAGDTTSYTMQWVLYNLAKHEHLQEQLHNELKNNSKQLLKYFIKETLRLYPVAPFITRFLPEEANIGPHKIPANMLIILSLYTSGRSSDNFVNPNQFNPHRWDIRTVAMSQATQPFAMGSRSCVGRKIAESQLYDTLEAIVRKFRVELSSEDGIEMVLKMIAVPSKPIDLKFVPR